MSRRFHSGDDKFQSINSCISTSFLMDMSHLITVEGLAHGEKLSEIQDSMIRHFGAQCGFCTPGFVMSITNLYENNLEISQQKIKNYLTGNLCRCTGYQPIIDAALGVDLKKIQPLKKRYDYENLTPAMEPDSHKPIKIVFGEKEFFAPTTLSMAAQYKKQFPDVRIFSGATDIGVQINKGKNPGIKLMSLHLIPTLSQIIEDGETITVGARVNLHQLQKFLEAKKSKFAEFLNIFASPQIKNAATLVGNLANGSPIADTTPFLLTVDAEAVLLGAAGPRSVPLIDFITGYKTFSIKSDEFITGIKFQLPNPLQTKSGLFKVSQRRDLDISSVNASFIFQEQNNRILSARIAYGGVGPKAIRLVNVEKEIIGKELNPSTLSVVKKMISETITPISDLRGTAEFRSQLCVDMFKRFVQENFNK